MTSVSTGDLARTYLLRKETGGLNATLTRLTGEIASGRKADLSASVSGDFRALAGLEHSLSALGAYKTVTSEAGLFAQTMQSALETTQAIVTDLAPSLAQAGSGGGSTLVRTTAIQARQQLFSAVSALNAQAGDRYVFSGDATDSKPLADGQAILGALSAVIAGQTTASGIIAAVGAWFDAPTGGGGFTDTIYAGAANPLQPFAIGPGEQADLAVTATDPVLRDTLKGLALGALVAEGALAGDSTGQANLLKEAGNGLMTANAALAELRARVGASEGQIEAVATRNQTEASALEMARSAIVTADPYETAINLEAARSQLETLYAVTARLSGLNLADYLR